MAKIIVFKFLLLFLMEIDFFATVTEFHLHSWAPQDPRFAERLTIFGHQNAQLAQL